MKTKFNSLRALAFAGVAFVSLALTSNAAVAADKKAHGEHGHDAGPAPKTSPAALESMHKLHAELTTQVKGKQLKAVHDTCEKLTAAAKALPAVSKDLPADKKQRVEGAVKNLAKALDSLHDAADEGSQASSEKHLKTVDSLMTLITGQYGAAGADAKKAGHQD